MTNPSNSALIELAERIRREDNYLIDYLFGWAGLGPQQPWGAATGFALEVAYGYVLIRGESDATLTERCREVVASLRSHEGEKQ